LKALKTQVKKRSAKEERERQVLIGVVDYYITSGKPVGSNTLKEFGFQDLSSATIRNYFASLENEGYLMQQHTSGGRIPTEKAYRLYAKTCFDSAELPDHAQKLAQQFSQRETHEIAFFLQEAAEALSAVSNCAVFISAPRFDHDYIVEIKVLPIDLQRAVCVMITDFGVVKTEVLALDKKLSTFSAKRIEEYFHWRLTGHDRPDAMEKEEETLAQKLYNELLVRYIISYSAFTDDDLYRTGFSKLLAYPDFYEATVLANSLSLFENAHTVRLMLKECTKTDSSKLWIDEDFSSLSDFKPECAVIAKPYYINRQAVGAIGILGPMRMPYKTHFALLKAFSDSISEALTRNIYKFKIHYRQPSTDAPFLQQEECSLLSESKRKLLEDKRSL